jgi:hypothetical protein
MKQVTYRFGMPQQGLPGNRRALIAAFVFMILALLGIAPNAARAQLYSGSLSGAVADSSGAVVVNADVTLTDSSKGLTHQTKSNAEGRYMFRELPPAVYRLSVSGKGFETELIPAVVVNVNENATFNLTLKVGQSNETVVVQADASEGLDTEDGSNGQVVDRAFISDLPLINRAVFDLSYLAPGVSPPAGGAFGPANTANNFVSQGSRNAQADILIDGITTTNYDQNSGFVDPLYVPSVDAVQEFKIQQTNFSAEFGFSGATVINVVTRSGTNDVHGMVYEYLRNTALNSENWFAEQAGEPNPAYHWNDFGGAVGGPVKKDKIFFFFDFEATREVTPTTDTLDLPTAAERTGDFGQVCTNAGGNFNTSGECVVNGVTGGTGQLWDPYMFALGPENQHLSTTFVPFNNFAKYASAGNFVGGTGLPGGLGNLLNPVSQAILKYIPLPNNGTGLHGNYIKTGSNVADNNQYDAKVDYQIRPKDMFSARWSTSWGHSEAANLFGNAFDSNTQGPVQNVAYQGAANYTHTFTANTILTATLGATHSWAHTFGEAFDGTTIGLPADLATNPIGGIQTAPSIDIDGYAAENGNGNFGGQEYSVLLYGQDVAHLEGSVSHVVRNHELKAGGEVRLHRINFTQWGIPNGRWEYQASATAEDVNNAQSGGDSMASFLTGFATGFNSFEDPAQPATQNWQYSGFVEDNWRAKPNLTLNLGFRYDLDMPRTERHDRMSYFDPTLPSPIAGEVSGIDPTLCPACDNLRGAFEYVGGGNSKYPYNVYHGAVGPRLGFSYTVRPTTAIRGGFGIYYGPGKTGAAGTGSGAAGFQGYATQANWNPYVGTSATNFQSVIPNFQTILGQDPGQPPLPYDKSQGLFTQLGGQLSGIPVKTYNALPREYTWSLGFEHQFGPKLLVDADYVGKHGQNLYLGGFTNSLSHIPASVAAAYRANPSVYSSTINIGATGGLAPLNTAVANATLAVGVANFTNPLGETPTSGQITTWNALSPYPQYSNGLFGDGGIQNVDPPIARSNYHGLIVRASRQMSQGLQFLVTYTAQQSFDNGSSLGSNFYVTPNNNFGVQDPNDIAAEYSLSAYNLGQIAQATFIYQLPFGKGLHWSTNSNLLDGIFGHWQTSGSYRWDSGQALTIGGGGQATLPGYNSRPNLNGQLKKSAGVQGIEVGGVVNGDYFQDPGVFSQPGPYTDGSAPRVLSGITAPGTDNFNFAVDKSIPLRFREGTDLRVRWESFNLFNHVQYAGPNTAPGTFTNGEYSTFQNDGGTFGAITSQANDPRVQQISLRVTF